VQALAACSIPRVDVDFGLCLPADTLALPSPAREPFYYRPEEEIAYGPAAWLWDYLRRR
jgi:NAD+ synthase (glutamine-hydrolysing)